MSERKWDWEIDGQLDDNAYTRVNDVEWVDAVDYGLDPDMVGLAVSTGHRDAKIELSKILIDHHWKHEKQTYSSGNAALVPPNIIDRLLNGMLRASEGPVLNAVTELSALRLNVPEHPRDQVQKPGKYRDLLHLIAQNPGIGKKKAASMLDISPTTVKAWMKSEEFEETLQILRQLSP